jgi:hypothetical protein
MNPLHAGHSSRLPAHYASANCRFLPLHIEFASFRSRKNRSPEQSTDSESEPEATRGTQRVQFIDFTETHSTRSYPRSPAGWAHFWAHYCPAQEQRRRSAIEHFLFERDRAQESRAVCGPTHTRSMCSITRISANGSYAVPNRPRMRRLASTENNASRPEGEPTQGSEN